MRKHAHSFALQRLLPTAAIALGAAMATTATARADRHEIRDQRHLVELGIYLGAFFPSSEHELYDYPSVPHRQLDDVALDAGLRAAYLPWPCFGLEVEGGMMPTETTNGESANAYHARGHLILQLARWPVVPFVVAGAGILGIESASRGTGDNIDFAGHWGLGLKYYVNERLALRIDGRDIITKGWGEDEITHHFEALAGASFILGWKARDSDGDGLADKADRCPHEAAKTANGCPPPDLDGDGVLDRNDACPDQPASTPDGCPVRDRDGDGVRDENDRCPERAAQTADGCPKDSDGDGVADEDDRCPQQAARTPDGCPSDVDGDGIVDAADKCPQEAETVNGFEDQDGCPDELPKQVKRFTGAIRGITFALGSAEIQRSSYPLLDAAVAVLKEYPALSLLIRGHTDSTGARELNLVLSERRAESVRGYLVNRGIEPARLAVQGVGPDEPISSNTTASGRAQNRRIEFKLVTERPVDQPDPAGSSSANEPTP